MNEVLQYVPNLDSNVNLGYVLTSIAAGFVLIALVRKVWNVGRSLCTFLGSSLGNVCSVPIAFSILCLVGGTWSAGWAIGDMVSAPSHNVAPQMTADNAFLLKSAQTGECNHRETLQYLRTRDTLPQPSIVFVDRVDVKPYNYSFPTGMLLSGIGLVLMSVVTFIRNDM